MAEPKWTKRYAEGIVIGVLSSIAFAGVAVLADKNSPFFKPLFNGLVAASAVILSGAGVVLLRRIPRRSIVPTEKNIETCVRAWLDNHKVAVKNDPYSDGHFRVRATLDSGCVLTIGRSKTEYPEYVQILCDLGIRGDDKKVLALFNEQEKTQILLDIKVELARAKVGYSGLVDPPENFQVFRRVPIYPTLTEFAFMSLVGDVEAARNLVFLAFLKVKYEKEQGALRESASDLPKLEPPTV